MFKQTLLFDKTSLNCVQTRLMRQDTWLKI